LPVAGGNRGYYLISNKQELDEYLGGIDGRIQEMKKKEGTCPRCFRQLLLKARHSPAFNRAWNSLLLLHEKKCAAPVNSTLELLIQMKR
jgi:hypothetical protein